MLVLLDALLQEIMSISFLRPPALPVLTFVRYKARPPSEKLKKPEDKSSIILGKWKPSVAFPKPGVSDKANPIHVKWERSVATAREEKRDEGEKEEGDESLMEEGGTS